ncbi:MULTISPECIES: hypothetical protein [Paenibacillus]|uniref:hypothetical protein n=1 Tax=Paenibacillus TaxID=44249 RepID=UPI0013D4111E|nr:hypothetical protein [Paenibacillus favisporus]
MNQDIKVSQWTAILIEQAKRAGLSAAAIAEAVQKKDAEPFIQAGLEGERYANLFGYSEEHGEPLAQAATEGYRMTFNTRNGLKNWLVQRFGLDEEKDFEVGEGVIHGLRLTLEQLAALQKALAVNWVIAGSRDLPGGMVELDLSIRALQSASQA